MEKELERRLKREAATSAKAVARTQRAHDRAVRRREGVLRRARQRLPVHLPLALGAGLLAGPVLTGGAWEALTGAVAVVSGVVAVRSALVLRRPPPEPVPPVALQPFPPPPSRGSVAWPSVRRLEAVREELRRLVPLVEPAGREAVVEAWEAAGEADLALRWHAARLAAVEPHRGPDAALLRVLEDGVLAQERLVGAVADLVAASVGDSGARLGASSRLQDAADRLHGLAEGLRSVR